MTWTACPCGRPDCTFLRGRPAAATQPTAHGGVGWFASTDGEILHNGTAPTLALAQAAAEAVLGLTPLATVPTADLMAELLRRGLDVVEPVRASGDSLDLFGVTLRGGA